MTEAKPEPGKIREKVAAKQFGLCADCIHARLLQSDRGSTFLQCQLAFSDPQFEKYPRLPVLHCIGYTTR
jgi:hypothetical protein